MLQGQEAYGQISTEKNSFSAGEKQNINSAKEIEAQGQDKTIKETASEIGANKQTAAKQEKDEQENAEGISGESFKQQTNIEKRHIEKGTGGIDAAKKTINKITGEIEGQQNKTQEKLAQTTLNNQGGNGALNGKFDWGNLRLNGLFTMNKEPNAKYLIETDKRFTDYKNFLSSDYLIQFVGYDPAKTLKRLGDGFYEQQIIREQIAAQSGGSLLDGYTNNEEQYKALLQNGGEAAKEFQLKIGIALTAEQINQLKKDIVWLEEKEISGQKVLVPVVYFASNTAKLETSSAIIKGGTININLTGDLKNDGKINAGKTLGINANNIHNKGGQISAEAVDIEAGGTIKSETLTIKQDYGIGTNTLIGKKGEIL